MAVTVDLLPSERTSVCTAFEVVSFLAAVELCDEDVELESVADGDDDDDDDDDSMVLAPPPTVVTTITPKELVDVMIKPAGSDVSEAEVLVDSETGLADVASEGDELVLVDVTVVGGVVGLGDGAVLASEEVLPSSLVEVS